MKSVQVLINKYKEPRANNTKPDKAITLVKDNSPSSYSAPTKHDFINSINLLNMVISPTPFL